MKFLIPLLTVLINSHRGSSVWIQKVQLLEGDPTKPTVKDVFTHLETDNPNVAKYTLTGPGVDTADYLEADGTWVQKFSVDPETGKVHLLVNVDRERKSSYELNMAALDYKGKEIEAAGILDIEILDTNDNLPEFVQSSLNGNVKEADDGKNPFMTLRATDADEDKANKKVYYFIQPNSDVPELEDGEGQRFKINNLTGEVFLSGGLDYEKDRTVQFNVIATNTAWGGAPQAKDQKIDTVTVKVEDSNDHAPKMSSNPPKSVSELSKVDTPLYEITATDDDEGVNQKVYFEIVGGNFGEVFTMVSVPSDDKTVSSVGYLELAKQLDFESRSRYELSIKAYNKEADNAVDSDFATIRKIDINVIDENESPVFTNTPYNVYLQEGNGASEVFEEKKPTGVVLTAIDTDFKSNQTITFQVHDSENWFTVNEEGRIIQEASVDRESPLVKDGVYSLSISATDNYDHGEKGSRNGVVNVYIEDVNDNSPIPKLAADDLRAVVCEKPTNKTVIIIEATDSDSPENGPPFKFLLDTKDDMQNWGINYESDTSAEVVALFSDYDLQSSMDVVSIPFTITDNGPSPKPSRATLTATICACEDGVPTCTSTLGGAGLTVPVIIAIIAILLLLVILLLALVAYRRRQAALVLKEPFFDDEDDVRENVQVYQEEGGEEDQEAYDLSALRAPLLEDPSQPVRKEVPLQQAPREPRSVPDDIGDYIGDAKDQADADPSAPPFDSLLVFDYEGAGSDAGSLSSINTATTDGSMDYDYLNNWGPRFKKLADMYNDGSDSE